MTKLKLLIRSHYISLILVISNSLFKRFTGYSLEANIELGIEIITFVSGLTLFFFHLKAFKKINLYFAIFAAITFFLILGLIFRGIFLGIVLSVLLLPIIPDEKKFEENGIIISSSFQGFMAPCCSYKVTQRQFLIFEKYCGALNLNGEGAVDFETVKISSNNCEIEILYATTFNKSVTKKNEN